MEKPKLSDLLRRASQKEIAEAMYNFGHGFGAIDIDLRVEEVGLDPLANALTQFGRAKIHQQLFAMAGSYSEDLPLPVALAAKFNDGYATAAVERLEELIEHRKKG